MHYRRWMASSWEPNPFLRSHRGQGLPWMVMEQAKGKNPGRPQDRVDHSTSLPPWLSVTRTRNTLVCIWGATYYSS